MDNRAGEMQVFLRVVETGSFSEAARLLRMTPSTVSKLVARIEARLGVRLVERSTRRLSLTAEGQVYYERSQALLQDLDAVERDLSLSDEIVDLYLDRTDIAFRIGPLPSSVMIARRIGLAHRKIVAAPAYLDRHGTPRTVDDLARHQCLGFNFRRSAPVWPLRESGRIVDRAVGGPLLANNGETVRRMALAGAGLARMGDYHVRADLAAGHLVEVLADVIEPDEEPIHAVFLGGPRMPHRARVFLDFVVPRLQGFLEEGVG